MTFWAIGRRSMLCAKRMKTITMKTYSSRTKKAIPRAKCCWRKWTNLGFPMPRKCKFCKRLRSLWADKSKRNKTKSTSKKMESLSMWLMISAALSLRTWLLRRSRIPWSTASREVKADSWWTTALWMITILPSSGQIEEDVVLPSTLAFSINPSKTC